MPNDTLKKLSITDFTPGIMQKLNRLSGDTAMFPLGAADATNTFRCIALPGGGLAPLPKQTVAYARSPQTPEAGTFAKVYNNRITISGAHMAGPIFAAGASGFTRQELHIAYEWGFNVSGTQYTRRYAWERHRLWEATPTVDSLVGYSSTDEGGTITAPQMRPTWFHTYRADASSQTALGAPLVVAGWYAGGGGLAQRFWDTFPNPSTLSSNTPGAIRAASNPEGIFGHQGRSVELDQTTWTHGSVGTWSFNEQVFYTKVNLASLAASTAAVYGQEDAEGFGAFGSVNASELMFVRVGYGGYVVRGDLDNPTVIYVPGIPGTGNARHTAAITPVGLVYGSRNGGVWAWAGGDTADLLSPNLDNDFWCPNGTVGDFVDYAGKFAFFKELILTPHNWAYDWRNKSWWRMEDTSVIDIFHWCQNTDSHVIYGAPQYVNSGSLSTSLAGWDASVPATSFSWESQPLPLGDYKTGQVREVVIVAQGVGTVKFTLSGYDAAGNLQSENHTGTWAADTQPEAMRFPVDLNALTHVRIRLESTATAGRTPVIWEATLMYREDTHLAAN